MTSFDKAYKGRYLETMKTIVIAGSASLQTQADYWKSHWEQLGYFVIDYPKPISPDAFLNEYPAVFQSFFDHLKETDVVFVMNEDKHSVQGYIGAETFAELAYSVYLRMKSSSKPRVIVMKQPSSDVRGTEELDLWHKLGLIEYFTPIR
jgi:hypothetical protein